MGFVDFFIIGCGDIFRGTWIDVFGLGGVLTGSYGVFDGKQGSFFYSIRSCPN